MLHCENGETVEASYADDIAIVRYKNRKHVMHSVISGSGARYVGDGMQWWTKGFGREPSRRSGPGRTWRARSR